MRKFSERSKRSLNGVHPDLVKVITRALHISPLDFVVIEGLRTRERQEQLVASGASQTMDSRHLTGHAVDLLPIGPEGPAFDWPLYDQLGPAVKEAAAQMGVEVTWGGDWKSFKDGPHFELDRRRYPATDWKSPVPAPKPRTKAESTTLQSVAGSVVAGGGMVVTGVSRLDGAAQLVMVAGGLLLAGFLVWIARERLRKWAEGDR